LRVSRKADTGAPTPAYGNQKFLRAFFKKRCLPAQGSISG
jgi:hypothetical protein